MTRPAKKRKPKESYLTRKADTVFSRWIRQRDQHCQSGRSYSQHGCEMIYNLQCAHGFTRARFATRWDPENAWALCRACHVYFTHRPDEWTLWMIDRLGREKYDELRARSLQPWKGDKNAVYGFFATLLREAA